VNRSLSDGAAVRPALAKLAQQWPTATAADGAKGSTTYARGNPSLLGAARNWPTPRANDPHTPIASGSGRGMNLPEASASLWQTPTADPSRMRSGERSDEPVLDKQAKALWQTPRAEGFDAERHRGQTDSLHSQTKAWPTPPASDGKRAISPDERDRTQGATLSATVSRSFLPDPTTETPGSASPRSTAVLSPRFVEWLMGFPAGWSDPSCGIAPTAFAAWEMAWSAWLRHMRSLNCATGSPRSDAA
jgi:hypothetical protein